MRVTPEEGSADARLKSPPGRSREVRPTSDRARETLFALLPELSGMRVLDLFCGTGALAIEAISRGADSAVLVDTKPALARRNVEELGLANRCQVIRSDAIRYLRTSSERFGLILCDPPYKLAARLEPELAQHLPPRLARHARLAHRELGAPPARDRSARARRAADRRGAAEGPRSR